MRWFLPLMMRVRNITRAKILIERDRHLRYFLEDYSASRKMHRIYLRDDIALWCSENLTDMPRVDPGWDESLSFPSHRVIWFETPEDAFAFKMRWV